MVLCLFTFDGKQSIFPLTFMMELPEVCNCVFEVISLKLMTYYIMKSTFLRVTRKTKLERCNTYYISVLLNHNRNESLSKNITDLPNNTL